MVLFLKQNRETERAWVNILKLSTVKAEKTARAINTDGGVAIAVAGDITNNQDIEVLVQKATEFGDGKLHIIVNNAGYAWDDPIERIKDEQWGKLTLHTQYCESQSF